MKIEKHHLHLLPIIVVVAIGAFLAFTSWINILAQTTNDSMMNTTITNTTIIPTPCSFDCSDWSPCSSSGIRTRTCVKKPEGCYLTSDPPPLRESCVYTPPATCSFNYSDWSPCAPNGIQTRSVISRYPEGCIGGTYETYRSCTYIPPADSPSPSPNDGNTSSNSTLNCDPSCSNWSSCYADGHQERKCTAPSGCPMQSWIEKKSCTYVSSSIITTPTTLNCSPKCSDWSECGADGFQARTCVAPSGCPATTWMEKKSCTYKNESGSTESNLININANNSLTEVNCPYQCSPWSVCYPAGYQDRMCQKPSGSFCIASREKRACNYVSGITTEKNSCTQLCSDWSICSPAGIKSQTCWPSPAGCPGEIKTVTQACKPTVCKFTYSAWGNCVDGEQFRTIINFAPAGCVGGEPVLSQSCSMKSAESIESTAAQETKNISTGPVDPDFSVNDKWKEEIFKTAACPSQICGGDADPDKDGLSNNDEYRYSTNPLNPDTDNDGKKDGEEVAAGTDPLKSSAKGEEDKIIFENPKETGAPKPEIYRVTNIEIIEASEKEAKQIKLSGKGPANAYVNVYIYSGEPIIVTVKTDSNGDWTYIVDRELENGKHEVYVAVTNNSGAIKAKSEPLPFVKTAQAVSVARAEEGVLEKTPEKSGISIKTLLFIFALAFFGVVLAIVVLGIVIKKIASKISLS